MEARDEIPAFAGWPPEALAFFRDLARDNTKAFFEAHREIYETAVREPMVALIAESSQEFGPGKIFRIHRDLRFSKIKTPYHTHIAATLGGGQVAAYYLQLTADGLFVAAGAHGIDRPALERYRDAVDSVPSGTRLAQI